MLMILTQVSTESCNLLQASLELEVVKVGLTVLTHDCLTSCTSGSSPLRSAGASTRSNAGTSIGTGWVTDSCIREG